MEKKKKLPHRFPLPRRSAPSGTRREIDHLRCAHSFLATPPPTHNDGTRFHHVEARDPISKPKVLPNEKERNFEVHTQKNWMSAKFSSFIPTSQLAVSPKVFNPRFTLKLLFSFLAISDLP